MKINGIIENRANEPWPRSISIDGKRMDYNNRWENTARGQKIFYKSPDDESIFQGVGILRRDILRCISHENDA